MSDSPSSPLTPLTAAERQAVRERLRELQQDGYESESSSPIPPAYQRIIDALRDEVADLQEKIKWMDEDGYAKNEKLALSNKNLRLQLLQLQEDWYDAQNELDSYRSKPDELARLKWEVAQLRMKQKVSDHLLATHGLKATYLGGPTQLAAPSASAAAAPAKTASDDE